MIILATMVAGCSRAGGSPPTAAPAAPTNPPITGAPQIPVPNSAASVVATGFRFCRSPRTAGSTPASARPTWRERSLRIRPQAEGLSTNAEFTNPITTWTPTRVASPSGISISGNHVYLACLAGQTLWRVDLDGRFRTVVVAPDGALRVTTSNLDRGAREAGITVGPDRNRILRITPIPPP